MDEHNQKADGKEQKDNEAGMNFETKYSILFAIIFIGFPTVATIILDYIDTSQTIINNPVMLSGFLIGIVGLTLFILWRLSKKYDNEELKRMYQI